MFTCFVTFAMLVSLETIILLTDLVADEDTNFLIFNCASLARLLQTGSYKQELGIE